MSSDKMDKYFKKKVQGHKTPLDTDALWEKIASEVVVEKKDAKKIFFFWLFGGLAIIATGLGFWLYKGDALSLEQNTTTSIIYQNNKNAAIRDETQKVDTNINITDQNLQEITLEGNQVNKSVVSNSSQEHKGSKEKSTSTTTGNKSALAPIPSLPKDNKLVAEKRSSNTKLSPAKKGISFSLPIMPSKEEEEEEEEEEITQENIILSDSVTSHLGQRAKGKKSIDHTTTIIGKNNRNSAKSSKTGTINQFNNTTSFNYSFLPTLLKALHIKRKNDIPISFLLSKQGKIKGKSKGKGKSKDKANRNKDYYSIAGFYEIGRNGRSLQTADENYKTVMAKRKSSEIGMETSQAGFHFNWHHKSGFYLGSGVHYTQINEKFTYFHEATRIEEVRDTIIRVMTTTTNKQIYNRFKLIDIPFHIGYEFGQEDGWQFNVELGLAMNLSLRSSGQIHGLDDSFVQYDKDSNMLFKKEIGMSYHGSIGVGKIFSDNWKVSTHIGLRYYPQSFNLSINPIEQKYLTPGLKLKVSYLIR